MTTIRASRTEYLLIPKKSKGLEIPDDRKQKAWSKILAFLRPFFAGNLCNFQIILGKTVLFF